MVNILFGVLIEGLKLWNHKEANKYFDEIIELQKEWINEYNKPKHLRSNADLDDIQLRLGIIARAFINRNGEQKI